jgi:RNA polymerase sigma-70 factor (ECF subfamily)
MVAILARPIERSAREDETTAGLASLASVRIPAEKRTASECSGDVLTVDFATCYAKELPRLAWFVMSLGANAHEAADVAQSAFVEAFPKWESIRHPLAWLRQVAGRIYYRRLERAETPLEVVPDCQGPRSAATAIEMHEEARAVLAALADLPAKQRQLMAWYVDGFSPAEIASELDADPAAVRQNLAKARRNLKKQLGIAEAP